ncbi:MAG: glycosyltransferase, partial [Nitrososphaerales archaeon]
MYRSRSYKVTGVPVQLSNKPSIAIHLPIYNERYVVVRLLKACTEMALAYDKTLVSILILDDSDDETSSIIDAEVKRYRASGFLIEAVRRSDKEGAKAGALQHALTQTHEDFVAIFDADFVPKKDFLLRTVPIMLQEPKVAIVQTRWEHMNSDYNFVTKAISLGIDGHF